MHLDGWSKAGAALPVGDGLQARHAQPRVSLLLCTLCQPCLSSPTSSSAPYTLSIELCMLLRT